MFDFNLQKYSKKNLRAAKAYNDANIQKYLYIINEQKINEFMLTSHQGSKSSGDISRPYLLRL